MNSEFGKKFANAKKKHNFSRSAEGGSSSAKKIAESSFFGVIIGLAASFALMFLFNIIAFGQANPSAFVPYFALASLFIGAIICGFSSAKKNGRDFVLCGIISGTIYILIIFFISLFIHREDAGINLIPSIITRLIVLILSVAGGFLCSKKKAAPKHKRRK